MDNRDIFLPADYRPRAVPDYFDDGLSIESSTVFQPEVYPVALHILAGSGRRRLVDVGCGVGRKLAEAPVEARLGLDFGANIARCREVYPHAAEWRECDLSEPVPADLVDSIGPQDVVVCSDVIEHLVDPRPSLGFLRICFERGAAVITSTPERVLVRGADHRGPPPNPAHVCEWALEEYRALLGAYGLPPLYIGLTHNNDCDRLLRTIISLHEPRLQQHFVPAPRRPLAILSCYNEQDVLDEVIEHWIAQGCDLHILDNWSTDRSWSLLQAAQARFGPHVRCERFPADEPDSGAWREILLRKEEIAAQHVGRWIIHTDADELRRSPFGGFNLADAMHMVERAGWNRISFCVLNHRPVDDRAFLEGGLATGLPYFEFGNKPGHFIQRKAWVQGGQRVSLAESGGHLAEFADARDCPYQFALHHYPLRSVEHGLRKINRERYGRWAPQELAQGWHGHYAELAGDAVLVWDRAALFDAREDFWARHGLSVLTGLQR